MYLGVYASACWREVGGRDYPLVSKYATVSLGTWLFLGFCRVLCWSAWVFSLI